MHNCSGRTGGIFRGLTAELCVLLTGFFAMNLGYFMVIPLLAVYMTTELAFSPLTAGSIMAISVGVQKGLTLVGGVLSDRYDRRFILLLGLGLRVIGYALFAASTQVYTVTIAALFASLGGSLFGPPIRAALAQATGPENRQSVFAARQIANNLGATVGPMAGAVLALYDVRSAFLAGSAAHLLLLLAVLRFVPRLGRSQDQRVRFGRLIMATLTNRAMWQFSVMTILFTVIYSQLTTTLPLRAATMAPHSASAAAVAATLFTVNGIGAVVLQLAWIPVSRKVASLNAFRWGAALCGAGLMAAGFAGDLVSLYAAVIVFTLGEVLAMPAIDAVIAEIAPERALGSYYGLSSLAWAVGGALGNTLGGWLSQQGHQGALPWMCFMVLGAAVALAAGKVDPGRQRALAS